MENPAAALFRKEAREQSLLGADSPRRLDVSPPWTWAMLWVVLAAIAVALALAVTGTVEVNSRAIGILRPATGVRVLTSQVAGTITSVAVQSGAHVRRGDPVLAIDAPQLQGQLLEAGRQVELLGSEYRGVSREQDQLHRLQMEQARIRLARLGEQAASDRGSLAAFQRKFEAMQSLERDALVSGFAVLDAQEAVAQATRRLASTQQAIAAGRQELAVLESQQQSTLWQRRQSLDSAQSRQAALQLASRQTRVQAPQDGIIEALLVKPGDAVQPGQAIGKLIPQQAPLQVVSFLPEKDRAFVQVGSQVRLELDQLPYGEYGTLGARVLRISDDLASPYEVQQALGDGRSLQEPAFRVILAITDRSAARAAHVQLRSGALMQVRYTLRRQRPITLVLEPLRKWLR